MKKIAFIPAALLALITCVIIVLLATFDSPAAAAINSNSSSRDICSADSIPANAEKNALDTIKEVPAETSEDSISIRDENNASTDPIVSTEESKAGEATKSTSSSAEVTEETPPSCCSYCGSQVHSYDYCAQRLVDNGAVGRWIIPRVGINVACYECTGAPLEHNQAITDNSDSAAYFVCKNLPIIGDHNYQDFSVLSDVHVGDVAYMDKGSYQQKYICTKFEYGHNAGEYLTDENYNSIYTPDYNPGGITCYTCNGNWRNIILVSFQPVND